MSNKFVSIYVPAYKAAPRLGATPETYRGKVIATLEKALEDNAAPVFKEETGRLTYFGQPDHRGEQSRPITVRYSVGIESAKALATILAAALDGLEIKTVIASVGDEVRIFDRDAVEGLGTGLEEFGGLE